MKWKNRSPTKTLCMVWCAGHFCGKRWNECVVHIEMYSFIDAHPVVMLLKGWLAFCRYNQICFHILASRFDDFLSRFNFTFSCWNLLSLFLSRIAHYSPLESIPISRYVNKPLYCTRVAYWTACCVLNTTTILSKNLTNPCSLHAPGLQQNENWNCGRYHQKALSLVSRKSPSGQKKTTLRLVFLWFITRVTAFPSKIKHLSSVSLFEDILTVWTLHPRRFLPHS